MFTKMYLKSVCNVASIGSLVPEKFDHHSLIMVHPKSTFNGLQGSDRENYFKKAT
jgi:hypothetical protein